MYHLYHFVPQCRRCGSWRTGRYVSSTIFNERQIKQALKHGEYILPSISEEFNCYCGDCGVEWSEEVKIKLLNKYQYEEQLQLRGVLEARESISDFFDEGEKEYRQEIKNKKSKRRKSRIQKIKNMIIGG